MFASLVGWTSIIIISNTTLLKTRPKRILVSFHGGSETDGVFCVSLSANQLLRCSPEGEAVRSAETRVRVKCCMSRRRPRHDRSWFCPSRRICTGGWCSRCRYMPRRPSRSDPYLQAQRQTMFKVLWFHF